MEIRASDRLRNRKTLSDLVAAELRDRIMSGSIPMGAELNQLAITQELNVSRAVVREAFRQLEAAGMIRLTPYHHAVVTRITDQDLEDLADVRLTVESLSIRRAIQTLGEEDFQHLQDLVETIERESDGEKWLQHDRQLHLGIAELSGNPLLPKVLDTVRTPLDRFLQMTSGVRPRRETANKEHRAILAAMRERDADKAVQLIREHVLQTKTLLKTRLTQSDESSPVPMAAETRAGKNR